MANKYQKTDTEKVAAVWDEFAQKYGIDRRASTPDSYLVDLEIRTLKKYIRGGENILDIGCGNGYTCIKLAQNKEITITGIDISLEMIKCAEQMLRNYQKKLRGVVRFAIGDILKEDSLGRFKEHSFDTVLTKRTLINVLTWEEQRDSILKIKRLIKPNGRLIMIEATIQGYENMNKLRDKLKIGKTPIRWHNNYLDEEKFIPLLSQEFEIISIKDFSSTYYLGSRIIQPFVLKPFKREPSYDFFLNRIFSYLPSIGNCGIQKIFVCRRKEV